MSRERSIKEILAEKYIQLAIKRGIKKNKLNKISNDCQRLENNLRPSVVDSVAKKVISYLEMEEPDALYK